MCTHHPTPPHPSQAVVRAQRAQLLAAASGVCCLVGTDGLGIGEDAAVPTPSLAAVYQ